MTNHLNPSVELKILSHNITSDMGYDVTYISGITHGYLSTSLLNYTMIRKYTN